MIELLNTLQSKNKLGQENYFNFVRKGAVRCNNNCIINMLLTWKYNAKYKLEDISVYNSNLFGSTSAPEVCN